MSYKDYHGQLLSIKSSLQPCILCVHKVDPSQSSAYTIECTKRGCSWTNWDVQLLQTVGSLCAPDLFTRDTSQKLEINFDCQYLRFKAQPAESVPGLLLISSNA